MTDRERLYKLTVAIGNAFAVASSGMQMTDTLHEAVIGAQDRLIDASNDAQHMVVRSMERNDQRGVDNHQLDVDAARFVLDWLRRQVDAKEAK